MNIRDRLDAARQKEFITIEECALLVGCSERTIWRRLPQLERDGRVIRDGRIVRLHRVSTVRHFLRWPLPNLPKTS